MADMLADGAAWLAGQLSQSAGRAVVLSDGTDSITITATIGRSTFEGVNTSGVAEVWESRDFLVTTGDLDLGYPSHGWTVTDVIDGVEVVFEVRTPAGVPSWHYSDAFRQIVRIHTTIRDTGELWLTTEAGEPLLAETGDLLIA